MQRRSGAAVEAHASRASGPGGRGRRAAQQTNRRRPRHRRKDHQGPPRTHDAQDGGRFARRARARLDAHPAAALLRPQMHGTLFVVWTMVAAISLSLAAVHGIVWLLDRKRSANLEFCVVAIAVAAMAATEFGMLKAATPAQFNEWLRGFHVGLFFFTAGLVAFVRLHFGASHAWLGWIVIGLRGVVTLGNVFGGAGASWQVVRLDRMPFLGDMAVVSGQGTIRP